MSDRDDAEARAREDLATRERIRYQWMLEGVLKFRFFFAGLVFAVLSFSVQFSAQTTYRPARWCQVLAWAFLVLSGMLALRDAGGFVAKYTQDVFEGLSPRMRRLMWASFLLGVFLLAVTRFLADGVGPAR